MVENESRPSRLWWQIGKKKTRKKKENQKQEVNKEKIRRMKFWILTFCSAPLALKFQ